MKVLVKVDRESLKNVYERENVVMHGNTLCREVGKVGEVIKETLDKEEEVEVQILKGGERTPPLSQSLLSAGCVSSLK